MPHPIPEWQHLALYAVGAALILMLLQRLPVVGRVIRFAVSLGLLAFLIYVVMQQAPYSPELARFTSALGLDDQKVEGKELHVTMSPDGHFWAIASVNGVKTRMLIDSGATITAISPGTARAAGVGNPVLLVGAATTAALLRPKASPVFGLASHRGKQLLVTATRTRWPAWKRLLVAQMSIRYW